MDNKVKNIFLTGATGVMGMKGMHEILSLRDKGEHLMLTVLARPGKRNEKKLQPFIDKGVRVIWGDLLDPDVIERGVRDADIVLHVGGMVSPAADWEPEKTYRVNTESMRLIVETAKKRESAMRIQSAERRRSIRVVYIGSVAQYGNRPYPHQWGRSGDPICSATFDKYALSKIEAERILAESGLKEWVSIRQTSILYAGLLGKADNPVAFHVPMANGLEWVTDEDSGRLLAALCRDDIPGDFWNNFYNCGGGDSYRMSNYEFMKATLTAAGCPLPEQVFELNWFATRNFHGMFFQDSALLDKYLHFRSGESFDSYMRRMRKQLPFYFRLAPLAPAFIIKWVMGGVADKEKLGTRRWIKEKNIPRIEAAYGSLEEYSLIPDWKEFSLPPLKRDGETLDHGYDESRDFNNLTFADLRKAAEFRGGYLESESMDADKVGNMDIPLTWICSEGHRFQLTPRTVLKGGHWCGECIREMERDPKAFERLAHKSPFLSQLIC